MQKTVLTLIGCACSIFVNVGRTQTSAPAPKFEVVSIKSCKGESDRRGGTGTSPGRLDMPCRSLGAIIFDAYVRFANGQRSLDAIPVAGSPAWVESEQYEIRAKADGTPTREMMLGPMTQAVLEERFRLKLHREWREIPIYELIVAKGGPKVTPLPEGSCASENPLPAGVVFMAAGQTLPSYCGAMGIETTGPSSILHVHAVGLDQLATGPLRAILGRPVINRTGLTGRFDIHLQFAPDESTPGFPGLSQRLPDPGGPSIFTAVQEELGLKLEPTKGPGEFLVVDSVERPTED